MQKGCVEYLAGDAGWHPCVHLPAAASPVQATAPFIYIYKKKLPSEGAISLPASWIQTQTTERFLDKNADV